LNNPNDTKDDCLADTESGIMDGNGFDDPDCPLQRDASATPNVSELIRPILKPNRQADKVKLLMVNAIEMRRTKVVQI
jgi:hypothetical protein